MQAVPGQSVRVVPGLAMEWVLSCTEWKSVEGHIERFQERYTCSPEDWDALLQEIPELLAAGLLVSDSDVLQWCAVEPAQQKAPLSIGAIGFPTGGQGGLEVLPRTVESFAMNLREYGRAADLVVCDSSLHTGLRHDYRARMNSLGERLGQRIRCIAAEEKERFAHELARSGACSYEIAQFALGDPLKTGFAPGGNRNTLLLDQAGAMFCSVDHDVLCRVTRGPEMGTAPLSFFSHCDPFTRWIFPDRAAADAATRWENHDHLALHEAMLGRSTAEVLSRAGSSAPLEFRQATEILLRRLAGGGTRVRATFCGHSGEPGVPGAAYYLSYSGVNRKRFTKSESAYRATRSSRNLLALSPTPALGDASLSPGVAFGVDNRELLPPFFPCLHAEDFSWSALAWQCCPEMVVGLLPWAVAHEPLPGKAFLSLEDLANQRPFVIWEWAHLLRFWTLEWQPPRPADAAQRIRAFGHRLEEIASLPAEDFAAEMRRVALASASQQIAHFDAQLSEEYEDLPPYWRDDIESYIGHLQRAVVQDGFELPLDLQQRTRSAREARTFAQQLVTRYAALLIAWSDIVTAAAELKANGHGMG